MNELERLLITRRSCRAYKPDAIPEDVLERIIQEHLIGGAPVEDYRLRPSSAPF